MSKKDRHSKNDNDFERDTEPNTDANQNANNEQSNKNEAVDGNADAQNEADLKNKDLTFDLDGVEDGNVREYAKVILEALSKENEALILEQTSLKEQIKKGDNYLNQLVVLKSDFENFKRRNANTADTSREEGKLFVVEKLLPILDTFDKARQMLSAKEMATFDLVRKQFEKILADVGVEKMEVLGEKFDPNIENAVHKIEVDSEEADGTVVEVYANGYKFGDKILRYATVCVGNFNGHNN